MPLRLLEVSLPESDAKNVRELIAEDSIYGFWREKQGENQSLVKMLLSVEQTERVLDLLEQKYAGLEGFRVVVLPVEATIPRIEEEKAPEKKEDQKAEPAAKHMMRISREELYSDIVDSTKLNSIFVGIDNMTNSAYRDHLSRVKSIMPEPGRNVRLLYRAYF